MAYILLQDLVGWLYLMFARLIVELFILFDKVEKAT